MRKFFFVFTIILMVQLNAFAWNTHYYDIYTNKKLHVEVTNEVFNQSEEPISLRWQIKNTDAHTLPSAFLTNKQIDPHCEIVGTPILLTSDYDESTYTWTQSWEFKVKLIKPKKGSLNCSIVTSHSEPKQRAYALIALKKPTQRETSTVSGFSPPYYEIVSSNGPQSTCETYEDCPDPERTSDNGGPDGVHDEYGQDRNGDSGVFDGGGYNNNNGL